MVMYTLAAAHFAKKMDCRVKPGNDGERPQFKTIYMIHTNS
jgi:hypothetical protein